MYLLSRAMYTTAGSCKEQMGLGLMMVKRMMVIQGGVLKISNKPEGEGTGERV